MTEVYFLKITEADVKAFDKMLSCIGCAKREKALKLKIPEKRLQTVLGEALLRAVLCTCYGFENEDVIIEKELNGKPRLKENKPYFNISHTGCLVAVAVSGERVGIDAEQVRKFKAGLIDRCCTTEEKDYINSAPFEANERFFEVWTKKEAFLKRDGVGLRTKPKEVDTKKLECVYTYKIDDYIASVCVDGEEISVVSDKKSREMLKLFLDKF